MLLSFLTRRELSNQVFDHYCSYFSFREKILKIQKIFDHRFLGKSAILSKIFFRKTKNFGVSRNFQKLTYLQKDVFLDIEFDFKVKTVIS